MEHAGRIGRAPSLSLAPRSAKGGARRGGYFFNCMIYNLLRVVASCVIITTFVFPVSSQAAEFLMDQTTGGSVSWSVAYNVGNCGTSEVGFEFIATSSILTGFELDISNLNGYTGHKLQWFLYPEYGSWGNTRRPAVIASSTFVLTTVGYQRWYATTSPINVIPGKRYVVTIGWQTDAANTGKSFAIRGFSNTPVANANPNKRLLTVNFSHSDGYTGLCQYDNITPWTEYNGKVWADTTSTSTIASCSANETPVYAIVEEKTKLFDSQLATIGTISAATVVATLIIGLLLV